MPDRRPPDPDSVIPGRVFFSEKITIPVLLYWYLTRKRYTGAFYQTATGFSRHLLQSTRTSLCHGCRPLPLTYPDFPGSFTEIQEEMYFHSNDALFAACSGNLYVRLALSFTGDNRFLIPLEKELLNRYTSRRTVSALFLKYLASRYEAVTYIPPDSLDIQPYLSPGMRASGRITVPGTFSLCKSLADGLKSFITPFALPFILIALAGKLLRRGISLSDAGRQSYDFGIDLQSVGLKRDRGLIDGKFFLYDDAHFHPSRVLHVVRDRLEDEAARKSLEDRGAPFVENGRIRVPARYLAGRVLRDFVLATSLRGLAGCLQKDRRTFLLYPALATMKMTMEAELFYHHYDVRVFIARDEYSPFHIVRTLVANRRGARTAGFQWADYWDRGEGLSHFVFDSYALWGEFYDEYLKKTLRHTRNRSIIGANIYGSDHMFEMVRRNDIPAFYRGLRDRFTIVAITGSSIAPEIGLDRETSLRFYTDAVRLCQSFDSVFCVLKPKSGELAEELDRLAGQYSRVRVEREMHTYSFLPVPDIVICIGSSTIGLEALMIGKKVIFYDVTGLGVHLYAGYSPILVTRTREELEEAIHRILRDGEYIEEPVLRNIRHSHGYRFDGNVVTRFRQMCLDLLAGR